MAPGSVCMLEKWWENMGIKWNKPQNPIFDEDFFNKSFMWLFLDDQGSKSAKRVV